MPLALTLAIESLLMPLFIGTVLLTLFVLWRLFSRARSRLETLIGVGSILIAVTGLLIHGISDYYTGVGFNEAALFHLKHGLSGLNWDQVWPMLAVVVLVFLGMIALFEIGRRRRLGRQDPAVVARAGMSKYMAATYLALLAINPAVVQSTVMASHAANHDKYSADIDQRVVDVDAASISPPEKPRSFIYLYAESFEASFIDDTRWKGLAPHMKTMEADPGTLSFRGLTQAPATGWTIAGMAASQCGYPVMADERFETTPASQGGATCLGDLLDAAGYMTSYMGGASLYFADKGDFYTLHGFDRVRGYPELQAQYPERKMKQSDWGLYDDDLFELALEEFDTLVAQDKPFGLFMLTLDTHPHDGYENEHCKRMGRYTPEDGFDMLDAVHCSDRLIHEFVQAVRSRPGGDEVVIIIASDHLQSTNSNIRKTLGFEHERQNLWMATGPGIDGAKIDRPATMFDIAPTMAQLLGMDVPALGLGRSLLEPEPTMLDEMGMAGLYVRLRSVFGGLGRSNESLDRDEIRKQLGLQDQAYSASTGLENSAPTASQPGS